MGSACCTSLKLNHSLGFNQEDDWRKCQLAIGGDAEPREKVRKGEKGSERARECEKHVFTAVRLA